MKALISSSFVINNVLYPLDAKDKARLDNNVLFPIFIELAIKFNVLFRNPSISLLIVGKNLEDKTRTITVKVPEGIEPSLYQWH